MTDTKEHLLNYSLKELQSVFTSWGIQSFRASQVLEWFWNYRVFDFNKMTNISKHDCNLLNKKANLLIGHEANKQIASDGTKKILINWSKDKEYNPLKVIKKEDHLTEAVLIPSEKRQTACVSSQIGCPVGCLFCASGIGGLEGNLKSGQILEQVWRLQNIVPENRISNIVFMGMGEPLANLNNVTKAIRYLNSEYGPNISARKITVSTVGIPKSIRNFSSFELPITLALSLHAPNDEIRRKLIPWAKIAPIKEILDACQEWFQKTGREITLEYLLIKNINDRPKHAEELADIANLLRSNINLIRYNEVPGIPYERPDNEDVRTFQNILKLKRKNVHIRASRGRDIAAACGQLKRIHQNSSKI